MKSDDFDIINFERSFFMRNKDFSFFRAILKGDKERMIFLNQRHNTIEIYYFVDKSTRLQAESYNLAIFGASYEALDALFEKYKHDEDILFILANFCLHSKSKSYWRYKLVGTPLAGKIMARILGANK